uniref:Lipocalin/cytosolic fatty-acid binding domain-containing protein n=1 Tax=Pristionchus pacificus TaxID=54126 RepID=A0A8R1V015_PRIPA
MMEKPKDWIYPFKIGEEFTAKGFDQCERKMLYTIKGDSIVERWHTVDNSWPDEISTYVVQGDNMIQSMVCGDATCKKFFKRKN